ncbi:oligosaccharide flippase family protein [bacterium]|nr:oligosaccharide flippase family protein [bacterium]MDB4754136.1 oligosaccharide flippase family protein [Akkermansiaceae bacterium]
MTTLLLTPILFNYLGEERYGLWLTITSFLMTMTFFDLGLGNGLLNLVSSAYGRDQQEEIRRALSNAMILLGGLATVLFSSVLVATRLLPLPAWIGISDPALMPEAVDTLLALGLAMALNIFTITIQRTQEGMQKAYVNSVLAMVANLLALGLIVLGVRLEWPLAVMAFIVASTPAMAAIINGVILFSKNPLLRPSFKLFDLAIVKSLFVTGIAFLVIQIAWAIGFNSDNIVISRILGQSEVTQYGIPMGLFTIPPLITSLFLTPLWPAYIEAIERGDKAWVRSTFAKSIKLAIIINLPLTLLLCLTGRIVIPLYAGEGGDILRLDWALMIGAALFSLLTAFNGPLSMLLNGFREMRFQATCVSFMAITNIAVSIALVRTIGIAGAVWGSNLAVLLFMLGPYSIRAAQALRKDAILPTIPTE